jgi:hypothetical protein
MQEISDAESVKLIVLTGCIFLILVLPLRFYLRNEAIKRIKKMLDENEVIVHIPKISHIVDYYVPLGIGGFIGGFLVPFWLYPELQSIRIVSRENLHLFVVAEIIAILGILAIYSIRIVLTNFRIFSICVLPLVNKMSKNIDIKYSDIEIMSINKSFLDISYIKTKQGKYIYLEIFENKQEVKNQIEMLMK